MLRFPEFHLRIPPDFSALAKDLKARPRIDSGAWSAIGLCVRKTVLSLCQVAFLTALPASAQLWGRKDVDFKDIEARAQELSRSPYTPPNTDSIPDWLKNLSYDQYRDIRANPERALWASDNLPFRAMFFHPGYLFREPVEMNEFTDTHTQEIPLSEAYFTYGNLVGQRGDLPPNTGFAGVRFHYPLNAPNVYDELAVFQGASYWRALGKNQIYGLSSRGLAIDTGMDGPEEFPRFRAFWLRKPQPNDDQVRIYALLDGPSVTGAYNISIKPGDETTMSVKAVLFPRKAVRRFGLAPMSSMFWFGENSRRRFDDLRPEVHDSDGLAIRMGSGERIWRPASNDSTSLDFSFFPMEKCEGFGLLQRDRAFTSYEDVEANYHRRPSLWIEPTSDWGPGRVMLMEIPTANELADNLVAMWEPKEIPQPGSRVEFNYRQHWTLNPDPSDAGGRVVATRTGVHDWQKDQRTMVVEFAGGALDKLTNEKEAPEAVINLSEDSATKLKVQGTSVHRLPDGRWRVAFQIAPKQDGVKLDSLGKVEMRCTLKKDNNFLTETWAYRINL